MLLLSHFRDEETPTEKGKVMLKIRDSELWFLSLYSKTPYRLNYLTSNWKEAKSVFTAGFSMLKFQWIA